MFDFSFRINIIPFKLLQTIIQTYYPNRKQLISFLLAHNPKKEREFNLPFFEEQQTEEA